MNPVPIMHKDGEQNKFKKMQLKVIKSIYTNFIIKEMCLQNPSRSSTDHNLNATVLLLQCWWWMNEVCAWRIGGMIADGKGKSTLKKPCFRATLSPINLTWAKGLNLGPYTDMATTKQLTWAKRCASWWKIHSKFDYIWNIIFLYDCQCYSVEKIRWIWRIRSQGLRKLANSTVQNH